MSDLTAEIREGNVEAGKSLMMGLLMDYAFDIVEALISGGANLEEVDSLQRRPIHIACWAKNLQIVELLINARLASHLLTSNQV